MYREKKQQNTSYRILKKEEEKSTGSNTPVCNEGPLVRLWDFCDECG